MKGILQVIPIEALFDEDFGVSSGDRFERVLTELEDRVVTSDDASSWLRLLKAIKKNAMFSIEATSPGMDIELRFSPDAVGGSYKITLRPRGEIEEGRVQKVVTLPVDFENRRLAKVREYQNRFLIGSSTNRHPLKRRAWIIGVDDPVHASDE